MSCRRSTGTITAKPFFCRPGRHRGRQSAELHCATTGRRSNPVGGRPGLWLDIEERGNLDSRGDAGANRATAKQSGRSASQRGSPEQSTRGAEPGRTRQAHEAAVHADRGAGPGVGIAGNRCWAGAELLRERMSTAGRALEHASQHLLHRRKNDHSHRIEYGQHQPVVWHAVDVHARPQLGGRQWDDPPLQRGVGRVAALLPSVGHGHHSEHV